MRNFREYDVWKNSIVFAKKIYLTSAGLPKSELYGIRSQIQRASVSISCNIAEGCSRRTERDFVRFIEIAQGSSFETESLLVLCRELEYINENELQDLTTELRVIQKQLSSLYGKLTK